VAFTQGEQIGTGTSAFSSTAVPEPASATLMILGLAACGLAHSARRRLGGTVSRPRNEALVPNSTP
jgi:hypothetical protein